MKIMIDGKNTEDKRDFYRQISEQLELPDYFGNNLDALYDVLTEQEPGIEMEFTDYDALEDALGSRFLRRLKRMLDDAGVTVSIIDSCIIDSEMPD